MSNLTKELLFIYCKPYDFEQNGKRFTGFSCRAFDPDSKTIEKVKCNRQLDLAFGDVLVADVVFIGRYINYLVA